MQPSGSWINVWMEILKWVVINKLRMVYCLYSVAGAVFTKNFVALPHQQNLDSPLAAAHLTTALDFRGKQEGNGSRGGGEGGLVSEIRVNPWSGLRVTIIINWIAELWPRLKYRPIDVDLICMMSAGWLNLYKNGRKILQECVLEITEFRQLQGDFVPWIPDQGLCPWTTLGAKPPDPRIGSRYRARNDVRPPLLKSWIRPCIACHGSKMLTHNQDERLWRACPPIKPIALYSCR